RDQLIPHGAASVVASVTSTRRTYGFFASCLRSKILVRRDATRKPIEANATASPISRMVFVPGFTWLPCPVSNTAVTVHTLHRICRGLAALNDIVNQVAMTVQTVVLQDPGIARRDHDRLVK